eukprot:5835508-Alexandrium_andersonii.AAC.1
MSWVLEMQVQLDRSDSPNGCSIARVPDFVGPMPQDPGLNMQLSTEIESCFTRDMAGYNTTLHANATSRERAK